MSVISEINNHFKMPIFYNDKKMKIKHFKSLWLASLDLKRNHLKKSTLSHSQCVHGFINFKLFSTEYAVVRNLWRVLTSILGLLVHFNGILLAKYASLKGELALFSFIICEKSRNICSINLKFKRNEKNTITNNCLPDWNDKSSTNG